MIKRFIDFNVDNSTALSGINKDTQIIIHACETSGGDGVEDSIAYKFARDNKCQVFAAKDPINRMKFDLEQDVAVSGPKIKKVEAYGYLHPVETCKIDGYIAYLNSEKESNHISL